MSRCYASSLVFCFYTSVFSLLLWGHHLNECGSQLALFEYAHEIRVVFLNDIKTGNDITVSCPLKPFLLVNTLFRSYKGLLFLRQALQ
ncbi:hypothetical protein Hanom_Chr06g00503341 [Helianthus anomalus]